MPLIEQVPSSFIV